MAIVSWKSAAIAVLLLFTIAALWYDYELQRPVREAELAQQLRDIDHIVEAVLRQVAFERGCGLKGDATAAMEKDKR